MEDTRNIVLFHKEVDLLEDIIIARDVKRRYGDKVAVDGISFSVHEGEIFGFLGKNGAGKSTTIKMLTGQLRADTGEISVHKLNPVTDQKKLSRYVGLVPEELTLYTDMTVEENLRFFSKLYGVEFSKNKPLFNRLDLGNFMKTKVKKLSKGYKQRVLIARALLNDPRIIFMDEPTSGLDPDIAQSIRDIIRDLKKEGKTIFLTTHYMNEAEELCDRVVFVKEGKIMEGGKPYELKLKYGDSKLRITKNHTVETFDKSDVNSIYRFIKDGFDTIHTCESTLEDVFIKVMGED